MRVRSPCHLSVGVLGDNVVVLFLCDLSLIFGVIIKGKRGERERERESVEWLVGFLLPSGVGEPECTRGDTHAICCLLDLLSLAFFVSLAAFFPASSCFCAERYAIAEASLAETREREQVPTASLAFSSEREKEEEDPLHQMAAGSHMFAFLSIDTG
ncbi:hypothetical protein B296_00022885 [Ensete ventricosum]|uniref:Transmembrane protein n=1 Tax=Ensete ventricosum TaxID=4639 RepID=A0A427A7W8_ENSVE|nr:hypothetical protein B296_00022885 [Ensete ventricosum]